MEILDTIIYMLPIPYAWQASHIYNSNAYIHADETWQWPSNASDANLDNQALLERVQNFHKPASTCLPVRMDRPGLQQHVTGPTQASMSRSHAQVLEESNPAEGSSSSRLQSRSSGVPSRMSVPRKTPIADLSAWNHIQRQNRAHQQRAQFASELSGGVPQFPRLVMAEEVYPLPEEPQPLVEEPEPSAGRNRLLAEEAQPLPLQLQEESAVLPDAMHMQADRPAAILFPREPSPPAYSTSSSTKPSTSSDTTETISEHLERSDANVSVESEELTSFMMGAQTKSNEAVDDHMIARGRDAAQKRGADVHANLTEGKAPGRQDQLKGSSKTESQELTRVGKHRAEKPKTRATENMKAVAELDGIAKRQAMLDAAKEWRRLKRKQKKKKVK